MRRVLVLCALLAGCGDGVPPPVTSDGGVAPDAELGPPDADLGPPDAAPIDADPTLMAFDLETLHEIEITVEPQYLDELENDTENRVPCTFTFDGVVLPNTGIRKKGGIGSVASLNDKTGFSVKFDEFVAGQQLHGLDRLTINNAIQDPTFLHEHLGYEVYRRAGIPAHRTAHAALTFNGVGKGLFVLAESADKKFLRRYFGDGNEEGNLYEGECCGDFVWDPNHPELKDEIEEMRSRADLYALAAVITDAPDTEFEAQVRPLLDLDTFITGYAIDAVFFHWDGYSYNTNNFYMYHRPSDDRFIFMPHGMDQLLQWLEFDPFSWPNGRLSQRIREIPALDAAYQAELYRVVDEVWDVPVLLDRIDQVAAVVHTSDRTDEAWLRDLGWFEDNYVPTRDAVVLRKLRIQQIPLAVCGDGAVTGVEQCDDGNTMSEDGCSSACVWEWCGDGVLQPGLGEVCDGPECLPDCSGMAGCTDVAGLGATYTFCAMSRPVWEARADCAARGGALAVPADLAQNDWIVDTAFATFARHYWIGVDDEFEEGVWREPDGTPVTFFAWAPGKPDLLDWQDCVVIDADHAGGWNDKACWDAYGWVCRTP